MLEADGFFGTAASLGADITLIVQTLFYIALCVGVWAQRQKQYKWHDRIQTPVVILNLFFIIFIMLVSFRQEAVVSTLPQRPTDPHYFLSALHGLLGTIAQGLAMYCLLAGHAILPRKIGRLRYWMWATFVMWTVTYLFGLFTYYRWYVVEPRLAANTPITEIVDVDPLATAEPGAPPPPRRHLLQQFAFTPTEITVVEGTQMIWLNQDGAPHNVAFADGSVVSDNFFQGETFEFTFNEPGTIEIYCTLHGNPGNGMASTVTILEATEETLAQVESEVELEIAEVETAPPPPPPVPPVPPAPVSLIEPVEPTDVVVGILSFRDSIAPSDSVVLSISGVPAPAEGQVLHAWLTSSETNQVMSVGLIELDELGRIFHTFTDTNQQNLMRRFDGIQITAVDSVAPFSLTGEVVASGRQAPNAYNQIRTVTAVADTPNKLGVGIAARSQAEELIRHVGFIQLAGELGSIGDAHRHAEHILNILDGEAGAIDYDGLHGAQVPGDGYGLNNYVNDMQALAAAASSADDATKAIQTHAVHVEKATNSALIYITDVRIAALSILEANSVNDIDEAVANLEIASRRALTGDDVDGNGKVDLDEAGIFIAYQHTQYMGAIGIIAGANNAIVEPETDLEFSAQLATGEVIINLADFVYVPDGLTIPAGTDVRFVNVGQALHSVVTDDGSVDTGLFGNGEEVVVTFDETGFIPFYCELHGRPGGAGMASSLTVVEPSQVVVEPTSEPLPEPTEAPPNLEFNVDMLDFTYSDVELVVPAGSSVTFFNAGNFDHSATADDSSWDTGLFGNGGQATITYAEPGTYPYFCALHGSPGGNGMAGSVTVVANDAAPPPPPPTPEPPPPTEAPPAAPDAVVIDMSDFAFSDTALSIPAGTPVTFINIGQFQHSATASDNSWDTGLYDTGGQATITFDEPGEFPYYCLLHGTAAGDGMAGNITVTPP